jgi:pyruvate kinase
MCVKKDDVVFFCIDTIDFKKYAESYPCVQIIGIDNFECLMKQNEFYYDDGKGCFIVKNIVNTNCFFAIALSDFILYQNKSLPFATPNHLESDLIDCLNDFVFSVKPEIIAGSFIEKASEVRAFKQKTKIKDIFMAKIETEAALYEIEEITLASDLIMVARGDLGYNTDISRLYKIQHNIIKIANNLRKPVYVATDILSSLQYRRMPSRADIVDLNLLKEQEIDGIILNAFVEDLSNAKKYIDKIF